jgi:uncharacterized DUF497 family protein
MKIEFDPAKNNKNIRERDLSFELVSDLDWASYSRRYPQGLSRAAVYYIGLP